MELRLLPIFVSLSLAIVASHAALSPEQYWDSVLPNTPIPKAIKQLLTPDFLEDKSTSVEVGKGGVNVDAGKGQPGDTSVGVGKGGVNVHAAKGKPGSGRTDVNVGKGGVNVHTGRKGKPVYVGVNPGPSPFIYKYAATETQLHDDPNVALFFLEKDLRPGAKLTLFFPKTSPESSSFLPREVAETLPFSSEKLPQILDRFSVEPASLGAGLIEKTIKECEEPGTEGEEKYCATSLESMVDFSGSKLGKEAKPMSTEVEKETKLQQFTVSGSVKKSAARAVACHKQSYPYAVFYCHYSHSSAAYRVGLLGADGTRANAVAVCHSDTSAWNPKHLAFQVLKVKPGTVPVCHFLPQDHVVWVPKY